MDNRDIISLQNGDEYIDLLKAQRVVYSESKSIQTINVVLVAISMIIPFLVNFSIKMNNTITIAGVIIAIAYLIFISMEKNKISEGANIQEQFDIKLFGLDWNNFLIGEKVSPDRVHELKSKSEEYLSLKDWYSKEIKNKLPLEIKTLLCQRTNISWDINLKKNFVKYMWIIIGIYYGIHFIIAAYKDMTITDILLYVVVPTSAFLTYGVSYARGLNSQKNIQKKLLTDIDELIQKYIDNKELPEVNKLRMIQDIIYSQRTTAEKIPDWFYKVYKGDNENKTDDIIENIVKKML